jgi:8-oxo-dGTP pyrophosphatase MutT (NUDIX family)
MSYVTRRTRLITSGEAGQALGVDSSTLIRWARDGRITPASKTLGGHLRWDLDDLRQQIQVAQAAQEGTAPLTETASTPDTATAPEQQPVVAAVITSPLGLLVTWRNDKVPPAGFLTGEIEPGESPADAMIREAKEEAGLRVTAGAELGRRVHPKTHRTVIYVEGQPVGGTDVFVGDEDELAEVRWVSLAEADEAFQPFGGMFAPVHDYLRERLDP